MAANDYTRSVSITPQSASYSWSTPPSWVTINRVGTSNDWTITIAPNSGIYRTTTIYVTHSNGVTTDSMNIIQEAVSSGGGAGPTATPITPTATPSSYTQYYLLSSPGDSTITDDGTDGTLNSTKQTTQLAGSTYSFPITITAASGYVFNQTIVDNLAFDVSVPARMVISDQTLVNSTTITATITDLNFPAISGGTTTISWTTGSAAVLLDPLTFTLYSASGTSVSTGRSYTWDLSGYPQTGHKIHMGIYGKDQVYTITGTSGYDLSYDVIGAAYAAYLNGLTAANWIGGTSYTYTQNNPKGFEPTASYDSVNNRLTFNMNWVNTISPPYVTTS